MSHFAVLVIGDDVEGQLRPFQENNMGDCPKELLAFEDQTEEIEEEYKTEDLDVVVGPRGGLYSPYDPKFRNPNYSFMGPTDASNQQYVIPENYIKKTMPKRERYASLAEYALDYLGQEPDKENGRYGYWENPNAKWDWYTIGGRYSGRLMVKNGAQGLQGKRSAFDDRPALTEEFVDQARLGDLDLEGMVKHRTEQRTAIWEEHQAVLNDPTKTVEDKKFAGYLNGVDEGVSREDFIGKEPFSVYAIVKDGKWHAIGDMGWFGMSSNEIDEKAWKKQLSDVLSDLPPETLLTIVDCHI